MKKLFDSEKIFALGAISGLFLLLLAPCIALAAHTPQAGERQAYSLAMTAKALISPQGARLEIVQEAGVELIEGQPALEFVIPAEAANLRLEVPGHTITRWYSEPVILKPSSDSASRRTMVEHERDTLASQLATIKAQLDVWQAQTGDASSQELEKRQELMSSEMPALVAKREELQRRLAIVERELSELPENSGIGQRIIVVLTSNSKPGATARVEYNYDLARCGWQAVYDFNALADAGQGDKVEVKLLAEVWQYTGLDWRNTEITLATLGSGPREPEPLRRWVVGAEPRPQPRVAAKAQATARGAAPMLMKVEAAEDSLAPVEANASVMADTDAIYATWTLAAKGLPEGRSRVAISSDTWQAPLEWLARPSTRDNRIWLFAKYDLPQNQAWPAGIAQFSLDGQSVGSGDFTPKGREATLYFGADPRMYVRTVVDSNRQGQTGFINTSKTWTGAWTYTLTNEHDKPVKVRVERPAPMVANENITVSYKDNPPSQKDDKEHMVYWDVTVPAHGKSVIEHSVTISSPDKLPLLPDIP